MAAVVAVKKEMRKKIKTILKDVSDAAAATQSMALHARIFETMFIDCLQQLMPPKPC